MDAMDDLYGLRGTNEQEKLKRHRSRRLITRRSEVRVLLPQPHCATKKDIAPENPEAATVSGFFRVHF